MLYVDIRGIGDDFHFAYPRLPDGALAFVKNERTMLHGHVLETILADDDDMTDYVRRAVSPLCYSNTFLCP